MSSREEILSEISRFVPDNGYWQPLDILLDELWGIGVTEECLPVLFSVFERFPTEDGAGVFWSIVHGVEALPFSYENQLRASLARCTSEVGQVLLSRLLKEQAANNSLQARRP